MEDSNDGIPEFDHIKVGVRCRPLPDDQRRNVQVIIKTDGDKLIAFYPESKEGLLYNYDYFFPEDSTQLDVFQVVGQELIDLVMHGYNACCIGYGPSGSGKTHTFFGSDQEHGLIQMATKELYQRLEALPSSSSYQVSFTYWEMSNDCIRDALSPENTQNLPVRKSKDGKEILIPGLREVSVPTWDDLDEWIMRGNITRIQLSEARSARWHGFLKLRITIQTAEDPNHTQCCTLTFGHLKGPDRVGQKGAVGDVLRHGSSINKSVSLLGAAMLHVVEMRRRRLNEVLLASSTSSEQADDGLEAQKLLAKTQKKLATESASLFNESKLTQVLMEALTGTCGTIILANVSTTDYHETTDTLENLQNAQQITVQLRRKSVVTAAGRIHSQLQQLLHIQEKEEEDNETQLRRLSHGAAPPTTKKKTTNTNSLAVGHPLTEAEERAHRLEEAYKCSVEGIERPTTPPIVKQSIPFSAAANSTTGPLWRKNNARANKHGDRATIYVPTRRGKTTYKGQWADCKKEGFGEHVAELTKYVGEWRNDKREGDGTLWVRKTRTDIWSRTYKGSWQEGQRHGFGTNWYPNGDIYEGYWADGQRSGIGKLYTTNGDKIEGQWKSDRTEGWATLFQKDGNWFEGHWNQGLREGPGVWHYQTKRQVYRGEWHLGIAKCGVIEDMPNKTSDSCSRFLPRFSVLDTEAVLSQTKSRIKDARCKIAQSPRDPLDDMLDDYYEDEEILEEDDISYSPTASGNNNGSMLSPIISNNRNNGNHLFDDEEEIEERLCF